MKDLESKRRKTTEDPLQKLKEAMENWKDADQREVFDFREVSLIEVLRVINEMDSTTTMGYDRLDSRTLKLAVGLISRPIQHVANLSFKTGKFCNKFKFGKLIPLHKGGDLDKLNVGLYRPISILPTITKIIERLAQSQIVEFMNKMQQFNHNLHAYKEMYSTTTAVLNITDSIVEAANQRKIAATLLLDQSAVFDCVDAHILLQKL